MLNHSNRAGLSAVVDWSCPTWSGTVSSVSLTTHGETPEVNLRSAERGCVLWVLLASHLEAMCVCLPLNCTPPGPTPVPTSPVDVFSGL